jgi:hypothetical protein
MTSEYKEYSSFYDAFVGLVPPKTTYNAGYNSILASRFFLSKNFETKKGIDEVADALIQSQQDVLEHGNPYGLLITMLFGGQVSKGSSNDTAILPAWRDARLFAINSINWSDNLSYSKQQDLARNLMDSLERWKKITPGSGTYSNEGGYYERNWQDSFFGSNYPRLREIKYKYDPSGLFVCRNCVGSDDWNEDFICPRRQ